MSLSDDLKNAVQESGKSINSIAKGAGVPQPVLSRSINGERDIRLETASKLAEFFGLSLQPDTKPRRKK